MINRLISLVLSILYIQILGWNLNINNFYYDNMVSQIYPAELQLNKTNTSDTEVSFLNLSISTDIVSTKIYDKRDDFDF